MSTITPTIGRKVWFWPDANCITSLAATRENGQPFDATIICVHDDGTVNLAVHDHVGHHFAKLSVPLGDEPAAEGCSATWMPYQLGQAKIEANVGTIGGAEVRAALAESFAVSATKPNKGKKAEPEMAPQGDKVLTLADSVADLGGEPRP